MAVDTQYEAGVSYTDGAVRGFALAAVVWGVVGMLVGVLIAAQLAWSCAGACCIAPITSNRS